ncbi:hypothetical protein DAI22_12g160700 [Oryza sativa Japonica Group]|nr:hypothetical protein DAI22_12g160700 [Oryza sativa Japonica Group]
MDCCVYRSNISKTAYTLLSTPLFNFLISMHGCWFRRLQELSFHPFIITRDSITSGM